MSLENAQSLQGLTDAFSGASSDDTRPLTTKRPSPFCIRLTPDERAFLEEKAGNRPLGAYIRSQLLGDKQAIRRQVRKPGIEKAQYAELLAALGHSHLSSNLNQLAKHANHGTLGVADQVEEQLQEAYEAILEMRKALFMALGLKSGGGP